MLPSSEGSRLLPRCRAFVAQPHFILPDDDLVELVEKRLPQKRYSRGRHHHGSDILLVDSLKINAVDRYRLAAHESRSSVSDQLIAGGIDGNARRARIRFAERDLARSGVDEEMGGMAVYVGIDVKLPVRAPGQRHF